MPERVKLRLSDEAAADWKARIAEAARVSERYHGEWDENLKRYSPPPGQREEGQINVNADFRQVESKKAGLFFDTPELALTPRPGYDEWVEVIGWHAQVLNAELGPDGAHVKRAMGAVILDALCPSGFGWSKIGYLSRTRTVKTQQPSVDPATSQPVLDPFTGQPVMEPISVEVPIYEAYFWERGTPKKLLIPAEYHSTDYEKAPWLGIQFVKPLRTAVSDYRLTPAQEDQVAKRADDRLLFHVERQSAVTVRDPQVQGQEVWYRAAIYDAAVLHPLQLRRLVFLDGLDEPVVHEESPFQTLDDRGGLTDDSMLGFPIHITTLRDLPDSAYVPSDCSMIRQLVDELNLFRSQMVQGRESSKPVRAYDEGVVTPDVIEKWKKAPVGGLLPMPEGAMTQAGGLQNIITEVAKASEPRQNYDAQAFIERDLEATLAIGANQSGAQAQTVRSATEVQTVQTNANARKEQERQRVIESFLAGVRKFDTLLLRFPNPRRVEAVLGPQVAQQYLQQLPNLTGRFTYAVKPDSGVFVDEAQQRQQNLSLYNLLRQDPLVNAQALLEKVLRSHHLDPSKVLAPPPEPQPEKPNVSFRFQGSDLLGPHAPIVAAIMQQAGFKIDLAQIQQAMAQQQQIEAVQAAEAAQPKQGEALGASVHGGVAEKAEPMDAHQMQLTGGQQGMAGGGQMSRGAFGVQ